MKKEKPVETKKKLPGREQRNVKIKKEKKGRKKWEKSKNLGYKEKF